MIEKTLPNGLKLAFRQSQFELAHIFVYIDAGSLQDTAGKDGLAHLVEHCIITAAEETKATSVDERLIVKNLNGHTAHDELCFRTECFAEALPKAIKFMKKGVFAPGITPSLVDREKEVILKEVLASDDNCPSFVKRHLRKAVFPHSRYGKDILGTDKTIGKLTDADVKKFIAKHFSPGNVTVLVVSGTEPQKTQALLEKDFGKIPKRKCASRKPAGENPVLGTARIKSKFGQTVIAMEIPVPGVGSSDYLALEIAEVLLGSRSKLFKKLRRNGLVYWCGCHLGDLAECNTMSIAAATDKKNSKRVRGIVEKTIKSMQNKPPSEDSFELAKKLFRQWFIGDDETIQGEAENFRYLQNLGLSRNELFKKIGSIRPHDVRKVARKYFGKRQVLIVEPGR